MDNNPKRKSQIFFITFFFLKFFLVNVWRERVSSVFVEITARRKKKAYTHKKQNHARTRWVLEEEKKKTVGREKEQIVSANYSRLYIVPSDPIPY